MDEDSDESDVYTSKMKQVRSRSASNVSTIRSRKLVQTRSSKSDRNKLSFGDEDHEDIYTPTITNNVEKNKSSRKDAKKPRPSGYGYGGYPNTMSAHSSNDCDDMASSEINTPIHAGVTVHDVDRPHFTPLQQGPNAAVVEGPLYGKESLSKLILEQKTYLSTEQDDPQKSSLRSSLDTIGTRDYNKHEDDIVNNKDFISFNSSKSISEPIILTGDEIFLHGIESDENSDSEQYRQNHSAGNDRNSSEVPSKDVKSIDHSLDAEGNEWEDTVTRRVGLPQMESVDEAAWNISDESTKLEEREKHMTRIKCSISSTILSLDGRYSNLQQQISRKKQDCNFLQMDIEKYTSEQTAADKKFDYYQDLRTNLITWIGALRDSNTKLIQIEDAFRLMSQEIATERNLIRREWEEDVYSVLSHETDLLDTVIGKRPINTDRSSVPMTDEFGRDLGSIHNLARSKRKAKRQKRSRADEARLDDMNDISATTILKEIVVRDSEDSDFGLDDDDLLGTEERRKALSDAVDVVLGDFDDEYTSVYQVMKIFMEWIVKYPDDFNQCFAKLSLAEMVLTLARFELCSKLDLLGHLMEIKPYKNLNQSLELFQWFLDLRTSSAGLEGLSSSTLQSCCTYVMDYVIRNACIPHIVFSLTPITDQGAVTPGPYDCFSFRQSQKLSSFYSSLYQAISDENKSLYMKPVLDSLWSHFRLYVDSRPTFVVRSRALDALMGCVHMDMNSEKNVSIMNAAFGQLYLWKKIIYNCCSCWASVLPRSDNLILAQIVLQEVCVTRVLPLLAVLEKMNDRNIEQIRCLVADIYQCILMTEWLEMKELIIISTPLRVIQQKYANV